MDRTLIVRRALISKRGMHPPRIVIELDVLENLLPRLLLVFVVPALHQLPLEGLEERLGHGVVVRVAGPRDRLDDPVARKSLLEGARGVLGALVRIKPNSA